MSVTDPQEAVLTRPQNRCLVCGPDNARGFQIEFILDPAGIATAEWTAGPDWEGYHGVLHGGVVCMLLDEAMAKAVIARDWHAMTVGLQVRYRHHVSTGEKLLIKGQVIERKKRRILAEASVTTVDGEDRAHAAGTFLTVD